LFNFRYYYYPVLSIDISYIRGKNCRPHLIGRDGKMNYFADEVPDCSKVDKLGLSAEVMLSKSSS